MKAWNLGLIIVVMSVTTISLASATPLDISLEEKINTTVDTTSISGNTAIVSYKTNVTGYINITNKGVDYIYDIWIAVKLVNNSTDLRLFYSNASSNVFIYESPSNIPSKVLNNLNHTGATHYIHIPLLKPNEAVSLFYDVDDSKMGIDSGSPFIVDESYNVSKIPANRDVTWKVFLNISLNETWLSKTALPQDQWCVKLNITKYLSNQTDHFGSNNWVKLGPISNPSTNKGNTQLWSSRYVNNNPPNTALNITDICLNTTQPDYKHVNITFDVTGNNTGTANHTWLLEPFGFATFTFSLCNGGNVSGSAILDVFAVGNASISANKTGPFYNETLKDWVDWNESATFRNTAKGLAYVLTNLSLWAVNTTPNGFPDMSDVITSPVDSRHFLTPNKQLDPDDVYTTENYTFVTSKVPVVWANCTFKLIKDMNKGWWANNTTLNDYNASYGSNYIVIEKIYVIGTYLIKVTKHFMWNDSANAWDVYIVVENIGGQKSPIVWVYDLVPNNFTTKDWDNDWRDLDDGNWVNQSGMLIGNGSTGDWSTSDNVAPGYWAGLYWQLNPLEPGADGDGDYQDWPEIASNSSVVIYYRINGTGVYHPIDAFIVGVDPMFTMDPQTAPKITIVSGAKTENYEMLMALLSGAIVIGGVVARKR